MNTDYNSKAGWVLTLALPMERCNGSSTSQRLGKRQMLILKSPIVASVDQTCTRCVADGLLQSIRAVLGMIVQCSVEVEC